MDQHEYELRTRGFTYLRGTLSPEYVTSLREAVDDAQAADVAEHGRGILLAMGQYGALRNLSGLASAFAPLIDHAPVASIMDALLGAKRVLHSFDALILYPGDSRYPWDFHTDLSELDGLAFPPWQTPAVNCLYLLDPLNADNGATHLVPASHKALLVNPDPLLLAELDEQASGQSGDALIFDARLWHCAGCNTSSAPRRLIKTLFAQPWIVQQMDYSRALTPEAAASLGPRRLHLLGVDSAVPRTVAELRTRLSARKTGGASAKQQESLEQ